MIEYGATKGVYIASPLTLMALLRSYALGWQQRVQEENAKKIAEIGRELYDRVRVFLEHLDNVGIALKRSIESYNKAVGSIERSVLPQGRKMKEAAALANPELPEPNILEVVPREMTALEKRAAEASRRVKVRFSASATKRSKSKTAPAVRRSKSSTSERKTAFRESSASTIAPARHTRSCP